jgi:hypothetical protein
VPENLRRFSGVKTLFASLPLILVSFTIGRMISAGKMWLGLIFAMGVLVVCTALAMFVPNDLSIRPQSAGRLHPPAVDDRRFTLTVPGSGQIHPSGWELTEQSPRLMVWFFDGSGGFDRRGDRYRSGVYLRYRSASVWRTPEPFFHILGDQTVGISG